MSKVSWRLRKLLGEPAKFVVWQTPESGDKQAPFEHPEQHLDRIWYSSTFDYYKVAAVATVTLTHQNVPAFSFTMGSVTYGGQMLEEDQLLFTHNLGYTPRFKIAIGSTLVQNYFPVQNSGGICRQVSFYATDTEIRVINYGCSNGAAACTPVNVTYTVLVFLDPNDGVDPSLPMFSARRGILARGKVKATDKLLRRSNGADLSPFDINLGPSVFIDNGAIRWFISDGTFTDFGTYGGSAVAPANLQCAVE